MRTPVIATSAGALPEVVADGETGLIVPAGDERALADAMASLLADSERCRRMGEAGRARVIERFTWQRNAHELEALYQEVRAPRDRQRAGGA